MRKLTKKEIREEIRNCYKLAKENNCVYTYGQIKDSYMKVLGLTKYYYCSNTKKEDLEKMYMACHCALDDLGIGHSYKIHVDNMR